MLPQFKAAGLAVVFDLTAHTFYRVCLSYSGPSSMSTTGAVSSSERYRSVIMP
jgi:hypothetical protein